MLIVDSGATNAVSGIRQAEDLQEAATLAGCGSSSFDPASATTFAFGNGAVQSSTGVAALPAQVARKDGPLSVQVLDADSPPLLGVNLLNETKAIVDFGDEPGIWWNGGGEKQLCERLSTGHLALAVVPGVPTSPPAVRAHAYLATLPPRAPATEPRQTAAGMLGWCRIASRFREALAMYRHPAVMLLLHATMRSMRRVMSVAPAGARSSRSSLSTARLHEHDEAEASRTLSTMRLHELQAEARKADMDPSGATAPQLREFLRALRGEKTPATEAQIRRLYKMKKAQLDALAEERGFDPTGTTKPQLINMLTGLDLCGESRHTPPLKESDDEEAESPFTLI